ncbi:MAG: hypothetical protein KDC33_05670 [Thermoleophilia bacterium]|nr:hypothetical protein [Thermoleophilia bacterium]
MRAITSWSVVLLLGVAAIVVQMALCGRDEGGACIPVSLAVSVPVTVAAAVMLAVSVVRRRGGGG